MDCRPPLRDEQYAWLQAALRLRPVHITSFGKMNFVHTVLSKRKLNWFVEQKLVEGWFDPRFPTVQGCVRRGMNVAALKNFIIGQGASKRIITMEWDKFWSDNKKILEESSPRFMGVSVEEKVRVLVSNVEAGESATTVQIHPQKPELGSRVMRRSNELYIDQCDAKTFSKGEEVTFLRWGNFFIEEVVSDSSGAVVELVAAFNPGATNFSKTKKATWVAATVSISSMSVCLYIVCLSLCLSVCVCLLFRPRS